VYRPKKFDAILEEMLFTHLEKINQLGAITAFNAGDQ